MAGKREIRARGRLGGHGRPGAAIAAALVALLLLPTLPACTSDGGTSDTAAVPVEETAKTGVLSFRLNADGPASASVPVSVSGTAEDGEEVRSTLHVTPGVDLELTYGAGSYTFSVRGDALSDDVTVYADAKQSVTFDGEEDRVVTLDVIKDEEATEALAAQRRAEEEAAEQARAQAEAEAAARAQAEAEAAARAQAEAQSQSNEQTVYITNTGEKYHRDGCRYLKKSKIPIALSDAGARGYVPCKVCF